jgi:hypothetical protein
MAEHDPEKLKAFWEYCETFKGWAKCLIAGNAAGLGYCLTVLNSPTPHWQNSLITRSAASNRSK